MASKGIVLKKFSHVVAKEKNGGIAYKLRLPWPTIPTDLKFLHNITTITKDKNKQNVVIMGRVTWQALPKSWRPLKYRFSIVLTSKPSTNFPNAHMVSPSLQDTMERLSTPPLSDKIENVYVLGGTAVYREALVSPLSDKIYITEVLQEFESDTFWPEYDESRYKLIEDDTGIVPQGTYEENGVKFRFLVYQQQ